MDAWRLIAERKIQEAMEEGVFEHLAGEGKPLDLCENPFENPEDRIANQLLRNNGFAPEWIMEAKEIEAESRLLCADGEASKSDFEKRVLALNRKIEAFNLKTPVRSSHKLLLEIRSQLEQQARRK